MFTSCISHVPFAQLPPEARALFSIYAIASLARYGAQRPNQSDLTPALEIIWNWNWLRLENLSDPFHVADLLIEHFAPIPISRNEKGSQ
jgi:hypothetical protein